MSFLLTPDAMQTSAQPSQAEKQRRQMLSDIHGAFIQLHAALSQSLAMTDPNNAAAMAWSDLGAVFATIHSRLNAITSQLYAHQDTLLQTVVHPRTSLASQTGDDVKTVTSAAVSVDPRIILETLLRTRMPPLVPTWYRQCQERVQDMDDETLFIMQEQIVLLGTLVQNWLEEWKQQRREQHEEEKQKQIPLDIDMEDDDRAGEQRAGGEYWQWMASGTGPWS